MTRTELNNFIDANLPDNDVRAITEEKLRAVIKELVDSQYNIDDDSGDLLTVEDLPILQNYSETEQNTGQKWVDGITDVWRKTWTGTYAEFEAISFTLSFQVGTKLIDITGFWQTEDDGILIKLRAEGQGFFTINGNINFNTTGNIVIALQDDLGDAGFISITTLYLKA